MPMNATTKDIEAAERAMARDKADAAMQRKDAERYRWLRDQDGAFNTFTAAYYNTATAAELDSAIDAAIATDGAAVGAA